VTAREFAPGKRRIYVEVLLTHGMVALVDPADAELVLRYTWRAHHSHRTVYARRSLQRRPDGRRPQQYMHTLITGWPLVDHINGDGTDNRRSNLRKATVGQNNANVRKRIGTSSQYKGVRWRTDTRRWQARIRAARELRHLGFFSDEMDAAVAYDDAARIAFGEFARLNFPVRPLELVQREPEGSDR
jgi:hypothetical protein